MRPLFKFLFAGGAVAFLVYFWPDGNVVAPGGGGDRVAQLARILFA